MTKLSTAALGAALVLSATPAFAQMSVREIGSFHLGGRQVTLEGLPAKEIVFSPGAPPIRVDPNGDFQVEQMYVRYTRLANPRARYPLLMWHGGGLTGVTWETKPDGKPGFESFFLRRGHDVYVSDAVERGRAGWARFPEIFPAEPLFRTKKEAWELFRLGPPNSYNTNPAQRVAHPGQQFPLDAFDQFAKQSAPRWTTTDPAIQKAYDELVQRVCPCVIMVHSQGGNFGFTAALNAPDKVKAVIAIEPSGSPRQFDAAKVKDVPHLLVWGDYLGTVPVWGQIKGGVDRYRDALRAAGARVDELALPEAGIRGNSHMLMMDRNSDEVARRIQTWMAQRNLMKPQPKPAG